MYPQQDSQSVVFLAKFGKRTHLEEFQRGSLYMKTVGYFQQLDATGGWGDPLEGLSVHLQPATTQLTVKTNERTWVFPRDSMLSPILIHQHDFDDHHIFCLAAVFLDQIEEHLETRAPIFSPRFLDDEQKDHVLLIQPRPFLDRLTQSTNAEGRKLNHGLVRYYERDTFDGELSPFHKQSTLKWQQEFRMLFEPSGDNSLRVKIPSLEDISVLVPAHEALHRIEVYHYPSTTES